MKQENRRRRKTAVRYQEQGGHINGAVIPIKDPKANGVELSRAIIDRLVETHEQPTEKAIQILKAEVGIYFG